ncbi:MAG: sulfatase-like hydrolase/transferase [Deltaproteobacteria bacterium]|nr:sulfatase-like hydrolase/transferase [Deltaproteobacteria bacterium]
MADAPEWAAPEEPDAARKSQSRSRTRQEFRPPRNGSPQSTKVSATSATKESRKRPNVVFLLADDLGYRDISCYEGPVKTPVLHELVAGGVRFTDFHSGAPGCSPSRASVLTGRHHALRERR